MPSRSVQALSNLVGKPRAGPCLTGTFDRRLQWTPDPNIPMVSGEPGAQAVVTPPRDLSSPFVFTAIQEQLRLKLESGERSRKDIVVDKAEKLSEN